MPGEDDAHYNYDYYNGFGDDYVPFDWNNESFIPTLAFLITFDVVGLCGIIGNIMILVVMHHKSLSSASYGVYLR